MAYPKKKQHGIRLSLCAWIDRLFLIVISLFIHHSWLGMNVNLPKPDLILPLPPPNQSKQAVCAVNKGSVIVSLFDVLAYNLLQIAFVHRMAEELCWDIVIRPLWNVGLEPTDYACFPNALPRNMTVPNSRNIHINDTILEALRFIPKNLTDMDSEWHENNERIQHWSKEMSDKGVMWSCVHPYCNFTESNLQMTIDEIRREESRIRVVYLENYFIHEEWLDKWRPTSRKLLTPNSDCCSFPYPPSDAIVIHIHDTNDIPRDRKSEQFYLSGDAYLDWLDKHKYIGRPLWIVCQFGCEARPEVKLLGQPPWDGLIVYPRDPVDTICLLSHASVLLVAPQSMLSTFAATLTRPNAIIHYPTTGEVPYRTIQFSLTMPDWNYHRVSNESIFVEWNVSLKNLNLRPSWTFS